MNEKQLVALRKALGTIPDNTGDGYLPKPVADELVEYIEEQNWVRQLVDGVTMRAKTLSVPTVRRGDTGNVYFLTPGTDVSAGGRTGLKPSTGALVLTAKKLMAFAENDTEDQEDGSLDAAELIMKNFAEAFAAAEEESMLIGNPDGYSAPDHLATFNGLYTIAADAAKGAHTPVTYTGSGAADIVDAVATAIRRLGVHGRNKRDLVVLVSSVVAERMRKETALRDASQQGTGTVVQTGTIPPVHGIRVIETTYLDSKESGEVAVLFNTRYPLVGDRRLIKIETERVPLQDIDRWVVTERLDFQQRQKDGNGKAFGVVLIHLETT